MGIRGISIIKIKDFLRPPTRICGHTIALRAGLNRKTFKRRPENALETGSSVDENAISASS